MKDLYFIYLKSEYKFLHSSVICQVGFFVFCCFFFKQAFFKIKITAFWPFEDEDFSCLLRDRGTFLSLVIVIRKVLLPNQEDSLISVKTPADFPAQIHSFCSCINLHLFLFFFGHAVGHVGSSRTRAQTRVPCIGRQILNHCATREVLK